MSRVLISTSLSVVLAYNVKKKKKLPLIPIIHGASKETYHTFRATLNKIHNIKIKSYLDTDKLNHPLRSTSEKSIGCSFCRKGDNAVN